MESVPPGANLFLISREMPPLKLQRFRMTQELLTLTHQPEALGPHGHVLVGYSTFSPGDYVDTLGSREHAHLMYTQLTFTF